MAQVAADVAPQALDSPLAELLDANYALADPAGHITRFGAGAARLFGVQAEQMVGRSLFDSALGGEDGGWRAFTAGEARKASSLFECTVRQPDGRTFPCEVRMIPVRLADGLDVSFLAGELTGNGSPEARLAALRARHARALALVEEGGRKDARPEPGERLAGLIATFKGDPPDVASAGATEALERAARAERELDGLREPVEQARAESRALAERLERVEQELRAQVEAAMAAAEQARREAEQARRELRGARQAFGGATRPVGFFTSDPQSGEPERPTRAGFDDAAMPMARLGLDGSFMELNSGFRELVGYSEEEFASARWPSSADHDHLEEQRALLRDLAAGEREEARVETSYMHREGLMVQLRGRVAVVRAEGGAPDHLLMTLEAPASSGAAA